MQPANPGGIRSFFMLMNFAYATCCGTCSTARPKVAAIFIRELDVLIAEGRAMLAHQ